MSGGLVAVHCGAGRHNKKLHSRYNRLSRLACKAGVDILKDGGDATQAVRAAVKVLEDDALTNAGYGSNLTMQGKVEMDAAVMDGKNLLYGGCGAVPKVKNPVELAYDICVKQRETLPLGLVPPSLLVGVGGLRHARAANLRLTTNKSMVSAKAFKQFKKYKRLLDCAQSGDSSIGEASMDTVGAVCVDFSGHVASASSSGGLLLKRPGRVGQAALYGSGVWADSLGLGSESSVAVCTTGCGEHLMQTLLAQEIGKDLKSCSCIIQGLHDSMNSKFLNSRQLRNVKQKLGGALVVHVTSEGEGTLLWGHSTESMSVGYMRVADKKATSLISQLPCGTLVGTKVNVCGTGFL